MLGGQHLHLIKTKLNPPPFKKNKNKKNKEKHVSFIFDMDFKKVSLIKPKHYFISFSSNLTYRQEWCWSLCNLLSQEDRKNINKINRGISFFFFDRSPKLHFNKLEGKTTALIFFYILQLPYVNNYYWKLWKLLLRILHFLFVCLFQKLHIQSWR